MHWHLCDTGKNVEYGHNIINAECFIYTMNVPEDELQKKGVFKEKKEN